MDVKIIRYDIKGFELKEKWKPEFGIGNICCFSKNFQLIFNKNKIFVYKKRKLYSSFKIAGKNPVSMILREKPDVVYAAIHEFGGIIKPKHGNYLKFKIGDQWKTVKQVVIPPRSYLGPAIKDNMNKIETIILNRIQKETK